MRSSSASLGSAPPCLTRTVTGTRRCIGAYVGRAASRCARPSMPGLGDDRFEHRRPSPSLTPPASAATSTGIPEAVDTPCADPGGAITSHGDPGPPCGRAGLGARGDSTGPWSHRPHERCGWRVSTPLLPAGPPREAAAVPPPPHELSAPGKRRSDRGLVQVRRYRPSQSRRNVRPGRTDPEMRRTCP